MIYENHAALDVSVIIPMYNAEAFIKDAIDSVLNQHDHGLSFEILIVDDGSKDGSAAIVSDIQDDRITLIRLSQNGGLSNARNSGLTMAQGKWIQFLDSDDRLDRRLFSEFEKVMQDEMDAFIYGIYYEYKDRKVVQHFVKAKDKRAFGHLSCAVNKIIRRNKCVRFEKGFLFEDVIFSVEMMRQDLRLAILPDVYYHYNCQNAASIIANFKEEAFVHMYEHIFSRIDSYDRLTRMYLCEIFVAIAFDRSRPLRMRNILAIKTILKLWYIIPFVVFNQNRSVSFLSIRKSDNSLINYQNGH